MKFLNRFFSPQVELTKREIRGATLINDTQTFEMFCSPEAGKDISEDMRLQRSPQSVQTSIRPHSDQLSGHRDRLVLDQGGLKVGLC